MSVDALERVSTEFNIDLSAWNPLDHPRDRHGRFRDKWSLSPAAKRAFQRVMRSFSPATYRSDGHAQAHLDQLAGSRQRRLTPRQRASVDYYLSDTSFDGEPGWTDVNATLRANAATDRRVRHVSEIDEAMRPLEQDMLLQRVVGPEAFGLTPEQMDGVEEWTGKLITDKAYMSHNLGTPLAVQGPHITLYTAVPRGTRVLIPGGHDRTVILDRETPLRITHVTPDGQGGWNVMAVAMPRVGSDRREAPRALGRELTPQEMSPAEEATPDAFRRRGLLPDGSPDPNAPAPPTPDQQEQARAQRVLPSNPEQGFPVAERLNREEAAQPQTERDAQQRARDVEALDRRLSELENRNRDERIRALEDRMDRRFGPAEERARAERAQRPEEQTPENLTPRPVTDQPSDEERAQRIAERKSRGKVTRPGREPARSSNVQVTRENQPSEETRAHQEAQREQRGAARRRTTGRHGLSQRGRPESERPRLEREATDVDQIQVGDTIHAPGVGRRRVASFGEDEHGNRTLLDGNGNVLNRPGDQRVLRTRRANAPGTPRTRTGGRARPETEPPRTNAEGNRTDYERMRVPELRAEAQRRGLPANARTRRPELIDMLGRHDRGEKAGGAPTTPRPRRTRGEREPFDAQRTVDDMRDIAESDLGTARQRADERMDGLTHAQMDELDRVLGVNTRTNRPSTAERRRRLADMMAGSRIESRATRGGGRQPLSVIHSAPEAESEIDARMRDRAEQRARIRALRDRAREDLRQQGFENPSSEMLEQHMATLRDQDELQLIRERSGGGRAPSAKPAAAAATPNRVPDNEPAAPAKAAKKAVKAAKKAAKKAAPEPPAPAAPTGPIVGDPEIELGNDYMRGIFDRVREAANRGDFLAVNRELDPGMGVAGTHRMARALGVSLNPDLVSTTAAREQIRRDLERRSKPVPSYDRALMSHLRTLAAERDIHVPSGTRREGLVALLQRHDQGRRLPTRHERDRFRREDRAHARREEARRRADEIAAQQRAHRARQEQERLQREAEERERSHPDGLGAMDTHQLRNLAGEYDIPDRADIDRATLVQRLRDQGAVAPHLTQQTRLSRAHLERMTDAQLKTIASQRNVDLSQAHGRRETIGALATRYPSEAAPDMREFHESLVAEPDHRVQLRMVQDAVDGRYGDLDVKVTDVQAGGRQLNFSALIYDQNGLPVGNVTRQITLPDSNGRGGRVYNAYLSLREHVQGSGFAQEWNNNMFAWASRSGIHRVDVSANIDVGGYSWATTGFDFRDANTAEDMVRRLERNVSRYRANPDAFLRQSDDIYRLFGEDSWQRLGSADPAVVQREKDRIARQIADAEALIRRARDNSFGSADFPSAFDMSQLGREPGQGRDDRWIGKGFMLGSSWSGTMRI